MRPPPSAAYASLVIVVAAVCLGCSVSTVKGTPPTSATGGSVSLSGWQLTLPLAAKNGAAAIVNPAAASPPWLRTDDSGGLAFFAPVDGAKTKNSDHARTELVGLDTFTAGSGRHTHYNGKRPHRARQLRPPRPQSTVPRPTYGAVRRRPVLGGLIHEYDAAA